MASRFVFPPQQKQIRGDLPQKNFVSAADGRNNRRVLQDIGNLVNDRAVPQGKVLPQKNFVATADGRNNRRVLQDIGNLVNDRAVPQGKKPVTDLSVSRLADGVGRGLVVTKVAAAAVKKVSEKCKPENVIVIRSDEGEKQRPVSRRICKEGSSRKELKSIDHKSIVVAGSAFDGNVKSTKAAAKKDGGGLGNRKALNDITNKAPLTKEQFKKNIPKEEFNVAEEGFLHDHTKCIEEQKFKMNIASFLDLVLPGHDSVSTADHLKIDLDDKFSVPEPTEISMSKWNSPPDSPIDRDSPPSSAFAWQFEDVEFVLKQEND